MSARAQDVVAARFWREAESSPAAGAYPALQLGRLAWREGRMTDASEAFARAARQEAAAATELAEFLRARGRHTRALAALKPLPRDMPEAQLVRGRVLLDQGRWKEALSAFEAAAAARHLANDAALGAARARWRLGERAAALDGLERAARETPHMRHELWGWLAVAAHMARDPRRDEALASLQAPYALAARLALLGRNSARARDVERWENLSLAATRRNAFDGRPFLKRARELAWQGRREEALTAARRARELGLRGVELEELIQELGDRTLTGPRLAL